MKLYYLILTGCGLLANCAHKNVEARKVQTLQVSPIPDNYINYPKGVQCITPNPIKEATSTRKIQVGNTYGSEDAIRIKSQVYAQVPNDITIFPEIHTADGYTPSTHETQFDLKPLSSVPTRGYYPDGKKAYTADTHIITGNKAKTQMGHTETNQVAPREYIHIRSGTKEIKGMGRILGITDKTQKKEAKTQLFAEEGESLHFVNKLGWIAIIQR